ncbi:unnamed protein product [Arctogadus glacialis]
MTAGLKGVEESSSGLTEGRQQDSLPLRQGVPGALLSPSPPAPGVQQPVSVSADWRVITRPGPEMRDCLLAYFGVGGLTTAPLVIDGARERPWEEEGRHGIMANLIVNRTNCAKGFCEDSNRNRQCNIKSAFLFPKSERSVSDSHWFKINAETGSLQDRLTGLLHIRHKEKFITTDDRPKVTGWMVYEAADSLLSFPFRTYTSNNGALHTLGTGPNEVINISVEMTPVSPSDTDQNTHHLSGQRAEPSRAPPLQYSLLLEEEMGSSRLVTQTPVQSRWSQWKDGGNTRPHEVITTTHGRSRSFQNPQRSEREVSLPARRACGGQPGASRGPLSYSLMKQAGLNPSSYVSEDHYPPLMEDNVQTATLHLGRVKGMQTGGLKTNHSYT